MGEGAHYIFWLRNSAIVAVDGLHDSIHLVYDIIQTNIGPFEVSKWQKVGQAFLHVCGCSSPSSTCLWVT